MPPVKALHSVDKFCNLVNQTAVDFKTIGDDLTRDAPEQSKEEVHH